MKTNKRDKGIKGKPTQDIESCKTYYHLIQSETTKWSYNELVKTIYISTSPSEIVKIFNNKIICPKGEEYYYRVLISKVTKFKKDATEVIHQTIYNSDINNENLLQPEKCDLFKI